MCFWPMDTHTKSQRGYSTKRNTDVPHTWKIMNRSSWCSPTIKDQVRGFACCPLNIKTIFRSSLIQSFLTRVQSPTPLEEQKCMVYCMLCECGSVYIRETGRQLKTHITEHKKDVTNANPRNAIAAHVWNTGHNIQVSETSGIDHEENWYKRGIKKALHIRSHAKTINTVPGLSLNQCWAARRQHANNDRQSCP